MSGREPGSDTAASKRAPRRAFPIFALFLLPLAAGGCSEWAKYWDPSPTRPIPFRDTTPPTVRLLSPSGPDSARATPVTGSRYVVLVEAADDVGVVRVALTLDDRPAVNVPGPPWEIEWDTSELEEGSRHRLAAAAADAAGNVGVSAPAFAQVFNAGPRIVLTAPADGARVLGAIEVAATFEGQAPGIERVEFMAGSRTFATLTGPPWTATLQTETLGPGHHFLMARAMTALGHVGVSPPVRIHVNNGAPTVTIVHPPDLQRIATRGRLILSGAAFDPEEGTIPGSRMSWTSSRDGPIGAGSYLRVGGLSAGLHTITGSARNAWGTEGAATIRVEVVSRPTYGGFCETVSAQLFRQYCVACHASGDGWLDLRSYAGLMAGGSTRLIEIVVPTRPESSLVWNKVSAAVPWIGEPMPPPGSFPPIPPDILKLLRFWILEGAAPDDPEPCAP